MVDLNENTPKKYTLRNIILSTIFTIGGFIVGAIVSNLVIVNRLDEKVRGIEVLIKRHELMSTVGFNKYERWLINIENQVDALSLKVAQLEANYQHLKEQVNQSSNQ